MTHRVLTHYKIAANICAGCGQPLSGWADWHEAYRKFYHAACCPAEHNDPSATTGERTQGDQAAAQASVPANDASEQKAT